MRSTVDCKIAGVCGGIAEYLEIDSTLVRLIWVLAVLMPVPVVPASCRLLRGVAGDSAGAARFLCDPAACDRAEFDANGIRACGKLKNLTSGAKARRNLCG